MLTNYISEKHVCNFDTDTCGWQQDTNDNFDWVQNSGRTMSIKTGPDCDHTNCKNGMELFITLMLQDSLGYWV